MGAERALEGAENEWELRGSAVRACGACVRGARARTEKQGEALSALRERRINGYGR